MAIFDVSLETANKFYTFGWVASLSGAFITLVGVTFLMWGTRVRDHDFELNIGNLTAEAAKSNLRAAQLELSAEAARLGIAEANERAAEAEKRAMEARLALEKYKEHRRLNADEKAEIASKVKELKGVRFAISADGTEALHLAIDVAHALEAGGLEWIDWPINQNVTNLPHDQHTVGIIQLLGTVVRTFNPALVAARNVIAAALSAPKFEGTNIEPADPLAPDFPAVLVMIGQKR